MIKQCAECDKEFETKSGRSATCSQECKLIRKKRFHVASIERRKEKFNCVYCDKEVFRYRKRGGFCSRSCASKKCIEDGTYDKWRLRVQDKKGITKNCDYCKEDYYIEPREIHTRKHCTKRKCAIEYYKELRKEHNPRKGIKLSQEVKQSMREKQKNTWLEKYGVAHSFALAKHTMLSRPQKALVEYLTQNTKYSVLVDFPIYLQSKCYKVDILIKELNLIIEFNGTYWHCDPRCYEPEYLNKKKNKLAKDIWLEDAERIKNLEELSYNVKVIWELDYEVDKFETIKGILNEYKEKNISVG